MNRLLIFGFLTFSFIVMAFAVKTNAAVVNRVDCSIFTETSSSRSDKVIGTPISFDISKIKKQGDGTSIDVGTVSDAIVELEVYVTNEGNRELTLQFNEKPDESWKSVLASTFLQTVGNTKLLYRAAGSKSYFMAICHRK